MGDERRKALVFDCFGVMVGEIYGAIRREVPEIAPDIEAMIEADTAVDLGKKSDKWRQAKYVEIIDGVGKSGEEVVRRANRVAVRDEVLMGKIKEWRREYKIGVLSNTGRMPFERYFSEEERREYFDEVVLSYEEGIMKPDRRIFEIVVERLGVRAEDVVFVDDREENVGVARNLGMRGVVYKFGEVERVEEVIGG